MTNFNIDGSCINFYDEIHEPHINSIPENDMCLISKEKLSTNFITLKCRHTFNYLPLYYNSIMYMNRKMQRIKHHNSIKGTKPMKYKVGIVCPYCRSSEKKLLPYLKSVAPHVKNITQHKDYVEDVTYCQQILKYGIRKGCQCTFLKHIGSLCKRHYNIEVKRNKENI